MSSDHKVYCLCVKPHECFNKNGCIPSIMCRISHGIALLLKRVYRKRNEEELRT